MSYSMRTPARGGGRGLATNLDCEAGLSEKSGLSLGLVSTFFSEFELGVELGLELMLGLGLVSTLDSTFCSSSLDLGACFSGKSYLLSVDPESVLGSVLDPSFCSSTTLSSPFLSSLALPSSWELCLLSVSVSRFCLAMSRML